MKPKQKTLKDFLKDEKKAVKTYRKYGYFGLAKDEARHARFIQTKIKKGGMK